MVLTRLRQGSALRRTTSDVDVEAVVERISQGDLLDGVPYRQRLAWGSELYVIEDRARRLVPYWQDQEWVRIWGTVMISSRIKVSLVRKANKTSLDRV